MIEYVIGGVLHGADTKDQIKVGGKIGSSRNHGAFVKIEDFKMLKFRRIV